jgi:Fe-S cluster biogenesis protein NfuA
MTIQETLDLALRDIQPMLTAAGRSVRLKEASETACVIELAGFCGDCACSSSYMEGIETMIRERAPEVTLIEFVVV